MYIQLMYKLHMTISHVSHVTINVAEVTALIATAWLSASHSQQGQ